LQEEQKVEKEAWREEKQKLETQLGQLVESVKLLSFDNDRLLQVIVSSCRHSWDSWWSQSSCCPSTVTAFFR